MGKTKLPSMVTILILTALTVFCWVGLDVYRALTIKPAPIVPAEVLNPLDPTLDEEGLNKLEQRVYIEPNLISPIPLRAGDDPLVIENTPTATVIPLSTPTATTEATLSPIPSPL